MEISSIRELILLLGVAFPFIQPLSRCGVSTGNWFRFEVVQNTNNREWRFLDSVLNN